VFDLKVDLVSNNISTDLIN